MSTGVKVKAAPKRAQVTTTRCAVQRAHPRGGGGHSHSRSGTALARYEPVGHPVVHRAPFPFLRRVVAVLNWDAYFLKRALLFGPKDRFIASRIVIGVTFEGDGRIGFSVRDGKSPNASRVPTTRCSTRHAGSIVRARYRKKRIRARLVIPAFIFALLTKGFACVDSSCRSSDASTLPLPKVYRTYKTIHEAVCLA